MVHFALRRSDLAATGGTESCEHRGPGGAERSRLSLNRKSLQEKIDVCDLGTRLRKSWSPAFGLSGGSRLG
jgi:hypothetical protein